jgi:hypothetical protein
MIASQQDIADHQSLLCYIYPDVYRVLLRKNLTAGTMLFSSRRERTAYCMRLVRYGVTHRHFRVAGATTSNGRVLGMRLTVDVGRGLSWIDERRRGVV